MTINFKKIENFLIEKDAQRLSKELIAQAKKHEPQITTVLQNIASEVSAQIIGLENKFKTEESLTRKLLLLAKKDSSNQSNRKKLAKFARLNNDALRHTFVFPAEKYAKGF